MGKRTSPSQQEQLSRSQLTERLVSFGWKVTEIVEDTGEDFIVEILFDGRSTGTNFYVQLKSVSELPERSTDGVTVYDFKVRDLTHWENFIDPVVLVVWDVTQRVGRWILVTDVVTQLEQRRPNWRDGSSARAYFQAENNCSNVGLQRLLKRLKQTLYPLLSGRPTEIHIRVSLPDSGETVSREEVERFHADGGRLEFTGDQVETIAFSDIWWRWFGPGDEDLEKVVLASTPSTEVVAVSLAAVNATGDNVLLPGAVELRRAQAGHKTITVSNEGQAAPLIFYFRLTRNEYGSSSIGSLSWHVNHLGGSAQEALAIVRFIETLADTRRLRIARIDANLQTEYQLAPAGIVKSDRAYVATVNALAEVEALTDLRFRIPADGLTQDEVSNAQRILRATVQGVFRFDQRAFEIELKPQAAGLVLAAWRQGNPVHFTLVLDANELDIFGQTVDLGPVNRHVTGKIRREVAELEAALEHLGPEESITIRLPEATIVDVFPQQFRREARRLARLLVEAFDADAVYLFGSLVWSNVHSPSTDIDLAVSGIADERFFEAVTVLQQRSKFPVDLFEWHSLTDRLRERIVAEGEVLVEKPAAVRIS